MTLLEVEMCALILRRPGVTGSEISDELAVTRSATSQIVGKLKAKRLISEQISTIDAKRKQLSLTRRGIKAATVAEDLKKAMADTLFGGESEAELASYLRFLTKLELFHSRTVQQWAEATPSPSGP